MRRRTGTGVAKQVYPCHRELNSRLASLSFGWRGKTVRGEADQDLNGVEDTQRFRTYLWLENVIAGWFVLCDWVIHNLSQASRS